MDNRSCRLVLPIIAERYRTFDILYVFFQALRAVFWPWMQRFFPISPLFSYYALTGFDRVYFVVSDRSLFSNGTASMHAQIGGRSVGFPKSIHLAP